MEALIKKPYEISLWEDRLTFVTPEGEYTSKVPSDSGPILTQYYKEYKIVTIGSDTMTTPIRVVNPSLKSNINGTSTLTFSIYSHYYDEDTDELLDNPFKNLLVNERKIKLRYGAPDDCQWYDFVIKNISEDSESKLFTYTAKDLFINELSKTGFNLEFDKALENNIGTVNLLAEKILEGSDWKLSDKNTVLELTKEEPLYKITLSASIDAENVKKDKPPIHIDSGNSIYTFYSIIENKENYFQFIYVPNKAYELNDRRVVTNKDCNYYLDVTYGDDGKILLNGNPISSQVKFSVTNDFRGNRFVRKLLTRYDPTIDKYVKVYTRNIPGSTEEVYGFTEHEYLSSNVILSYVTNPVNFANYTGWKGGTVGEIQDETDIPDLNIAMVPDVRDVTNDYNGEYCSYIYFKKDRDVHILYNSGVLDNRSEINGFTKDLKYVFRIKYGQSGTVATSGRPETIASTKKGFTVKIAPYTLKRGSYQIGEPLFTGSIDSPNDSANTYLEIVLSCLYSMSYSEMLKTENLIGIFLDFNGVGTYYVQDMQFFKYRTDGYGNLCLPNLPVRGIVKTKYYFYLPNDKYTKLEDVLFLYEDDVKPPIEMFAPKYNIDSFEKIRTIDGSESNRFNLLLTLCEVFLCWVRFDIEHELNGQIKLDADYRQLKWVTFYETIEKRNDCGFRYGINLKAIKRDVESEGIVSKIIVKNNSNEFADDGFCSIARAEENYARENFVLDFSYYIRLGLLNFEEVNNDLYASKNNNQGFLGYYKLLRDLNLQSLSVISELSLLVTDIIKFESKVKYLKVQLDKTEDLLKSVYSEIKRITGKTFEQLVGNKEDTWWKNDEIVAKANLIQNIRNTINILLKLLDLTEGQLVTTLKKYDDNKATLKNNLEEKAILDKKFFKKYSRFIQEGSWISEDYVDDNLYYLDAESTLHTSSLPKVGYTINVLELSALEEYSNYKFLLGDKSFIEDTKFFGWSYKNNLRTPYREEIVVTEINISLDSPELNTITVLNYKTQFEDLFLRITATTLSLEFSSGQYNKVSNIIEPNGEIKFDTLQNTIANNSFVIQNSKNLSVVWDDTGITTTSIDSPNEVVRIVSGGIFLSKDGGLKWDTGITGNGINANLITAGQINTNLISILNGAFPSFRWDSNGLSAYKFDINELTGLPENFNYGKFIRIDLYGLYGISGDSNFDSSIPDELGISGEQKIKKYSNFALTWSGFQIKSEHAVKGYISITSDKDFLVIDENGKARVHIGLLNSDLETPIYGLLLMDNEGNTVLEQSTTGKVWIRDSLRISSSHNYDVLIGNLLGLKESKGKKTDIHEVFNANNKFKVYEDGSMHATSGHFEGEGKFEGEIIANSGRIGNVTIGDIEEGLKGSSRIEIQSLKGNTFKINLNGIVEDGTLPLTLKLINITIEEGDSLSWFYSYDFKDWHEKVFTDLDVYNPLLVYDAKDFKNGVYYLRAMFTKKLGKSYEAYYSFYSISDGAPSEEKPYLEIFSNSGEFLVDGLNITLTAKVIKNGEDITSSYEQEKFSWKKINIDGTEEKDWAAKKKEKGEITGNVAIITDLDIELKATFDCSLLS